MDKKMMLKYASLGLCGLALAGGMAFSLFSSSVEVKAESDAVVLDAWRGETLSFNLYVDDDYNYQNDNVYYLYDSLGAYTVGLDAVADSLGWRSFWNSNAGVPEMRSVYVDHLGSWYYVDYLHANAFVSGDVIGYNNALSCYYYRWNLLTYNGVKMYVPANDGGYSSGYSEGYAAGQSDGVSHVLSGMDADFVSGERYTGVVRKDGVSAFSWWGKVMGYYNSGLSLGTMFEFSDATYRLYPDVRLDQTLNNLYLNWCDYNDNGSVYASDGVHYDSVNGVYTFLSSDWNLVFPDSFDYVDGSVPERVEFFKSYYAPLGYLGEVYQNGYADGSSVGYIEGYNDGASVGYGNGYNQGLNDGAGANTINLAGTVNSIVAMPFRFMQTAFHLNIPLADGTFFHLGTAVMGIFGIVLIFKVASLVFSVFR